MCSLINMIFLQVLIMVLRSLTLMLLKNKEELALPLNKKNLKFKINHRPKNSSLKRTLLIIILTLVMEMNLIFRHMVIMSLFYNKSL